MTKNRPRQAVILAGGRGTRMRPLTDERPKPMIEIAGRPFLEYVVQRLAEQGFARVHMLLGYRADVIVHHFSDGRSFGVDIDYTVSAPDDLTARRLLLAEESLDPLFLLLYCDNYWPLDMDRLWDRYQALGVPVMTTIYANDDGYSRDNVRVNERGLIEVFDRTRSAPNLKGVEISYAIMPRDMLRRLPPGGDELVEQALYPGLAAEGLLGAYVTSHRYYSVGSLHRLPITEAFFSGPPTVILDRDGVLNERPARAEYVRSLAEFQWRDGSLEALALLRRHGYRVIVVSNQAGIARGAMTAADVEEIHRGMQEQARAAGGAIDAVYFCPHGWDEGCPCRKPAPGMLFDAQHDHHLDLSRTPFIGDDDRDGEAAAAAGMPYLHVSDAASLLDHVRWLTDQDGERMTA
jgi:D-glycero-D-manno-heptose 1,7-bisphosphate phosphatase